MSRILRASASAAVLWVSLAWSPLAAQLSPLGDPVKTVATVVTGPVEGIAPTGYFESYNGRWAVPDQFNTLPSLALRYSAEDRSVNPADDYVSISYFPQGAMQINDLSRLSFDMFLPEGSACSARSMRAEILLNDNAPDSPRVRATLKTSSSDCRPGRWNNVNLLSTVHAEWSALSAPGRGSVTSKGSAHTWARRTDVGGKDYSIWAIRIQFLGSDELNGAGFGPEAWIDNVYVNGSFMAEPAEDLGFYANFSQDDVAALSDGLGTVAPAPPAAPGVVAGRFMSRNVRWGIAPVAPVQHLEALHFAPESRTEEDADFMSVSFFPQADVQLDDLTALNVDYLPENSDCDSGEAPRFWVVAQSADGAASRDVFVDWTFKCKQNQWRTLEFLTRNSARTDWSDYGMAVPLADRDQAGYHSALVGALGDDYRIEVIRLVHENSAGNTRAWLDNVTVNAQQMRERVQDFSPASQVPETASLGDGFVARVAFPDEQVSVSGDGATVLQPGPSGQIRINFTPYFDGRVHWRTGELVGRNGIYQTDGAYDTDDLQVAFYDASGQQSMTFQNHPELRAIVPSGDGQSYDVTLQLPADFAGGVYTVVVSDILDQGNSYDNRASYYFLGKELLLANGGATLAPVADTMDTPEQLLHFSAAGVQLPVVSLLGCEPEGPIGAQDDVCGNYYNGGRRGYEGPRSPVVILPLN